MKCKIAAGEYRSAQAMQKDFVLVMQNCVTFNSADSDIVKEARRQALQMPALLKAAAISHDLFLAEDGSCLEVNSDDDHDDVEGSKKKKSSKKLDRKDVEKHGNDWKKGKRSKAVKKGAMRREPRCGNCQGCIEKDCSKCDACSDKLKFGGTGKSKRICVERICILWRKQKVKSAAASDGEHVSDTDGENEGSDVKRPSLSPSGRKPRIRISLSGNASLSAGKKDDALERGERRKRKKRRREDDDDSRDTKHENCDDDDEYDVASFDKQKGRKKRKQNDVDDDRLSSYKIKKKKKKKHSREKDDLTTISPEIYAGGDEDGTVMSEEEGEIVEGNGDVDSQLPKDDAGASENGTDTVLVHLDLALLKREHSVLDGSFGMARNFYLARGPWCVPSRIGKSACLDIAKNTLNKMSRYDEYNLFASPVSDDVAPGYSTIVKFPMDFGKMKSKIDAGDYDFSSNGIQKLFSDFLLVMDNCALYNQDGSDVSVEATRITALLPEAFATTCIAASGKKGGRKKKKKIY
eukprot:CAMPEP_0171305662 /NCGR_PEP_ID=MMETSP0816-20121228/15527_1 /TAXON_ID=420281 /ORGANISM="Proboscia inermis, Strain CCAP1064/1" /LENGTH=520 /DNA_ID=CAMNT_0011786659 /DNA_START=155 /DNA_END=1717 /DNA_ORIENTATION=+